MGFTDYGDRSGRPAAAGEGDKMNFIEYFVGTVVGLIIGYIIFHKKDQG
jgi:F0F1-type ATP synthase assembly protein I